MQSWNTVLYNAPQPKNADFQGHTVRPTEIVFEAYEAEEGGYYASASGYSIFTQGDDWDDLREMVQDAVLCHFDDGCVPLTIKLRLVKNEVIPVNEST